MADELRIGDYERERVIAHLRAAVGEGRLSLDEFADRATEVYVARTQRELDVVVVDLPAQRGASTALAISSTSRPSRSKPRIIAFMSGQHRKGRWRVAPHTKVWAIMGGAVIDLRDAEIEGPEIVIVATAIMGGIDVIVPEGIPVDTDGFLVMGGFDNRVRDLPAIAGAPTVRVIARGMWGGVTVRSRPRKP